MNFKVRVIRTDADGDLILRLPRIPVRGDVVTVSTPQGPLRMKTLDIELFEVRGDGEIVAHVQTETIEGPVRVGHRVTSV